jgi:hypothetical protein
MVKLAYFRQNNPLFGPLYIFHNVNEIFECFSAGIVCAGYERSNSPFLYITIIHL